jgi:16S rRNA (cytosine967-C5)-methyltransferase
LRAVAAGAPFADARDAHVGGLAERDRRLAHELAAGVLRHRASLDSLFDLGRADQRLHDILRLGAYQLQELTRVPAYAAVSTSVTLARETAGSDAARYVNATLRRIAAKGPSSKASVGSHPDWLVQRWRQRFGPEEAARLVDWNDRKPFLTLQPARWSLSDMASRFRAAGFQFEDAPFAAGLRVTDATGRSPRPTALPGFDEGGFVVQDAGAALVCRFAAVTPGALLYDACAAPGGKTASLSRAGVQVIAGDAQRQRLPRLLETVRRSTDDVVTIAADLLAAPFAPSSFDAVLVDAPCSATGVIARHPDARWRLSERAIARLAVRQAELLTRAAELVRPGGVLIYATCSLEAEENVGVVNAFLERRPGFHRAPVRGAVTSAVLNSDGDLELFPQRHQTDGAYAARLLRAA